MASRGAPVGNTNATKNRPWAEALNRALLAEDGQKLRKIADKLIEVALAGDVPALKEIGDRIDGKALQGIELSGDIGVRKAADMTDDDLANIVAGAASADSAESEPPP